MQVHNDRQKAENGQEQSRGSVCPRWTDLIAGICVSPLDKSDPRDLRVPRWTNLDAAVGNPDSIPARPELSVLAPVGEADVSHSRAVVLEHVGHLKKKKTGLGSPEMNLDFEPPASQTGSYLMPLLIVPLLKVDGFWGKGLHGTFFLVQQLDADLILAATVPAGCVPKDKCLQSLQALQETSEASALTDVLTNRTL